MDPFIGEIRLFAFNFVPVGWMACSGQLLPISQYTALFSLLGATYGGNGQTTFALPDLTGRVPVGHGQGSLMPRFEWGQEVDPPALLAVVGEQADPEVTVWSAMPGFLAMSWCIAVQGIFPSRQ